MAFLFVVTIGSMWEARRGRSQKSLPLFVLSVLVAASLFGLSRLV
jgi:hypothetical protein